MSGRLKLLLSVTLVIAVLSVNLSCITIKAGAGGSIPVVTPKVEGPNEFDLPGTTSEIQVSSKNGATYNKDGVPISVPATAMASDGKLLLKEFTQHPDIYVPSAGGKSLPTGISISKVYDLGPNGVKFGKPVTVSLPYEKEILDSNYDKKHIQMAYYNGKNWVTMGGLVDTGKATVTASFNSFPGVPVALILAIVAAATSVGVAGYQGSQYIGSKKDGAAQGKAKESVMPQHPLVAEWTHKAGIQIRGQFIPLEDPDNPGKLNPAFNLPSYDKCRIGFNVDTGGHFTGADYPKNSNVDAAGNDTNWTPPDEYFKNGMVGDCTCHANAFLSMFRRLGLTAYAVEAYKDNSNAGESPHARHTWVEVLIGDKVFFYDVSEGLVPLSEIESKLDRVTTDIAGDQQMWDENGQKKYVKDWWKDFLPKSVAAPTGDVMEKLVKTTVFHCELFNLPCTYDETINSNHKQVTKPGMFYIPGNAIALGGYGEMNIKWSGSTFTGGGMKGYPDKLNGTAVYNKGKVLISFDYVINDPANNLRMSVRNVPVDPKYFMHPEGLMPGEKASLHYMNASSKAVKNLVSQLEWKSHEETRVIDRVTVMDSAITLKDWSGECGFQFWFK